MSRPALGPAMSMSYAQSVALIEALHIAEAANPRLNPDCRSIVYHHGRPTRRAVVFLHGITSSPIQFGELAQLFYARGYNVVVPRMPRHGYLDRLTTDPANLDRAELTAYAAEAVQLGRGLAEHLTVAGLSVSGVLAAWCGQNLAAVDLAVPIAPSFAPIGIPFRLVPALATLATVLPNIFLWWDPRKRARLGPACSYPRFSTHAMAESFRLAHEVLQAATHAPPKSRAILTVTNSHDGAVNNGATRAVVRAWRANAAGAKIEQFEFARREIGPLHDFIGPYQPKARVDYVYPVLVDLIHSHG